MCRSGECVWVVVAEMVSFIMDASFVKPRYYCAEEAECGLSEFGRQLELI